MALNVVPVDGQSLGNSKPLVRGNFSVIDTAFAIDHVAYNAAGQGKHNKITFPVQAMAPAFAAGELGLFNLLDTTFTNLNQLYYNNAAGTQIPITASKTNQTYAGIGYSYNYSWTYFTGGFKILLGKMSTPLPAFPLTVVYPVSPQFPGFTAGTIPFVYLTETEGSAVVSPFDHIFVVQDLAVPTHLSFKLNCHNNPSATVSCFFVAIGV